MTLGEFVNTLSRSSHNTAQICVVETIKELEKNEYAVPEVLYTISGKLRAENYLTWNVCEKTVEAWIVCHGDIYVELGK